MTGDNAFVPAVDYEPSFTIIYRRMQNNGSWPV